MLVSVHVLAGCRIVAASREHQPQNPVPIIVLHAAAHTMQPWHPAHPPSQLEPQRTSQSAAYRCPQTREQCSIFSLQALNKRIRQLEERGTQQAQEQKAAAAAPAPAPATKRW